MLVMLIPDEAQVNPGVQNAMRNAKPGVEYDFKRPQAVLGRLLRERGVECIDLLPPFLEASRAGRGLYLLRNTHWSGEGQELAANAVARRVDAMLSASR
jgi:hypothetical protein